jgi:hypothetical protein
MTWGKTFGSNISALALFSKPGKWLLKNNGDQNNAQWTNFTVF